MYVYYKISNLLSRSDVKLNGYHIPTGAQIIPLQHFVHNDPNLWDEPESFKPERFITAEGTVKKPDCFLPFGVGKIYDDITYWIIQQMYDCAVSKLNVFLIFIL